MNMAELHDDYDPVFIITAIGLRRLQLETKEDADTLTKKEGLELRQIRAGVRQLTEVEWLEAKIPHFADFASTKAAMERLSELNPRKLRKLPNKPRRIRTWHRHDPRFLAF